MVICSHRNLEKTPAMHLVITQIQCGPSSAWRWRWPSDLIRETADSQGGGPGSGLSPPTAHLASGHPVTSDLILLFPELKMVIGTSITIFIHFMLGWVAWKFMLTLQDAILTEVCEMMEATDNSLTKYYWYFTSWFGGNRRWSVGTVFGASTFCRSLSWLDIL